MKVIEGAYPKDPVTNVILGYPWFYNKNSSLVINWVHHSISIVSSPSISELSYSSLFYCVIDPDIHIYNGDSVPNHLSYFEQQLDEILKDFCEVVALLRACVGNEAGPPGSWTEE